MKTQSITLQTLTIDILEEFIQKRKAEGYEKIRVLKLALTELVLITGKKYGYTKKDIINHINYLRAKGLKHATIYKKWMIIKQYIIFLIEHELQDRIHYPNIKKSDAEKYMETITPLTKNQIQKLVNQAKDPEMRDAYIIASDLGLRTGEIQNIDIEITEYGTYAVIKWSKTKTRKIPTTFSTQTLIKRKQEHGNPSIQYTSKMIDYHFKKDLKRLGIQKNKFYIFRYTRMYQLSEVLSYYKMHQFFGESLKHGVIWRYLERMGIQDPNTRFNPGKKPIDIYNETCIYIKEKQIQLEHYI